MGGRSSVGIRHPLFAILFLACATSGDQARWAASMQAAPFDEGVARTYTADFVKTLHAAENALQAAGLSQGRDCPDSVNATLKVGEHIHCIGPKIDKIDDHTSVIGATRLRGTGSKQWWSGEQVRIVVQESGPNQTTVRVLSKYQTETIVGRPGDYSGAILDEIARELK